MKEEYRTDTSGVSAVVMITDDLIKDPSAAVIYSRKEIPNSLSRIVNEALNTQIRHDKLIHYNIPQLQDIMKDFDQTYSIRTVKWSEDGSVQESNSGLATASGMVLTILIYIFVLSYGGMVMQSVMEEKTNRIVELMVSSVKPFQLMIGKIIGIGLVGIVQLCIWGIMLTAILAVAGSMLGIAALQSPDTAQMMAMEAPTSDAASLVAALHNLNAIGASINEQEDSQQFIMPITLLMIFALYAAIASGDNPDGPLAQWCSMIPFTSPIVMMVRVPFDAPMWEILLSLVILYGTALGMIWIAGKIYRIGILMYGKKPSLKEMMKWITYK